VPRAEVRTVDRVRPFFVEIVLLALAVVLAIVLIEHRPGGGEGRGSVLASWARTPGVLNETVTQATIRATICTRGWTRTIRPPTDYTNALKVRQLREYGLRGPPSAFQEDHLISLELGGNPVDRRNLWPEPYPRASAVDRVENDLNRRVCGGELTLAEAQRRESELKHTRG
jgi:hypothetical protein